MIDITQCNLEAVSVHQIGNKYNNTDLLISKGLLDISNSELREILLTSFTQGFKPEEQFEFTFSNSKPELNPIFTLISQIFENPTLIHKNSILVAQHLYDCSNHPHIKDGDFYMAYFSNLLMDDHLVDAVGIFKIEAKIKYLSLKSLNEEFIVDVNEGMDSKKLDKGCLIFNVDRNSGYKINLIDNSNKNVQAQYWSQTFLNLRPSGTDYNQTSNFLSIAKRFVSQQLPKEVAIEKTEQAHLLNESINFFKNNEHFNRQDFLQTVFQEQDIISSFDLYENQANSESKIGVSKQFEISNSAVKKQARIFKSVLKLDKNFHIYIHGNKNLIEQGKDPDGRKFYKIYFENES